jgi:iron(III) transport system ATP-binding protein
LIDGKLATQDGTSIFDAKDGHTAMFRPQDLTIQPTGAATGPDAALLAGQIEHRAFLGNLIRYNVAVGGHSLIVDDSHSTGANAFSVGDDVALSLNTKNIRILTA